MKKAEQGDVNAQFNVGVMYYNGYEVLKDYKKAFYWYEKAAEQGDVKAQFNLGLMYYNGYGVLRDEKKRFIGTKRRQRREMRVVSLMWG